ncbi:MAG: FAD-binding oxidoreductase [Marmoricola sp.]
MSAPTVKNWFGGITSNPSTVVEVRTADEIVSILTDTERYPAPVRAVGSNHSTTGCGTADDGTLIVTRKMDRILDIGTDTVTVQAGALYIDVNEELRKHGLQFFVNVELGNLTIGSACCGGTKDASMAGEFGQIASYAVGIKMVLPSGELFEVDESDPELLQVARSSYGLFGIVYEATFRVRKLAAMEVHHEEFSFQEFSDQLPELRARGDSMMLYINPFKDSITVEFRRYHEIDSDKGLSTWQWKLRNEVWSHLAPLWGYHVWRLVSWGRLRSALIDFYNELIVLALTKVIKGKATVPIAQQIRYPEVPGNERYLFSIWAFPEERYLDCLKAYFDFSKEHYKRTGYRINLLSVGYRILEDQSSLFSYSYEGTVMTFDPVSTANFGWDAFLREYNSLCSELGGTPLFNQTNLLTRGQVARAFGDRIAYFEGYRQKYDPTNRLLNNFFRELIASDESH